MRGDREVNEGPFRILIVGGGTAGWMSAAIMARLLPKQHYSITLIESEEIGTVGVGEATIPQIQLVNAVLGIDEDDFMRATQGTFKLGIEFVGWGIADSRYIHAFGNTGRPIGRTPFQHFWLRGRTLGELATLDSYCLNAAAAYAGKFTRGTDTRSKTLGGLVHAFHFDAGSYARFLRHYAERHGVRRLEGRITHATRDGDSGDVASVALGDGSRQAADLYLDCSGFRGLLIEEALHTGYEEWTRWLPCDRALVVQSAGGADITPYTRATAKQAGWQWRIPLQNRIGNGHVYCSGALDEDEASSVLLDGLDSAPLGDPRSLRFTTGRRKAFWNRNVVALGLAAGFMEPLESTSIHLVQSAIERILKFLPNGPIRPADVEAYNAQTIFEWERVRDFIILHYHANARPEPFWQQCAAMPVPDSLTAKIDLFRANGRIERFHEELFSEAGWLQVMVGQGIAPLGYDPFADGPSDVELREFLALLRQTVSRSVATMPAHAAFLAEHCRAA
ncbi:tryptophan halogenase family protein [Sphingomonas abietis]|uniref:Tryptophan 7-halogenase n=1 Tax=Sphingomonas abietis TaxID=3012344 RepID=A0ABY7NH93_9SPHN|nr:tryptophan halogenase family protein [Sphingomonas abietis]WBO20703.1 tryptophan 7-halogenase [Sphingomonas abietis]